MMRTMRNTAAFTTALLVLGAAAGSAQQQCTPESARPSLGIGVFHCQGGTCMVNGATATMDASIPAQAQSMREANARAYWFSVEPRLYRVDGPAAAFAHEGDILVAVNGSPITTRAAGMALAEMQPGAPIRLTVRRDGMLLEDAVMPVTSCAQIRVSAGSEIAPAGTVVVPSTAGVRGGRGGGRGRVTTTQTVPLTVTQGNTVSQQDVTIAVRDTTLVVRRPLYVVEGVVVSPPVQAAGRGGRGGRGGVAATPGRVRMESSGLVLAGDKSITIDPNGAVRWWFTSQPAVVEVVQGSAAARAGFEVGDVLQSAGTRALTTAEGVAAFIGARQGSPVTITVRRGNSVVNLELFGRQD